MYADLAIITRPGADERKPETAGTEQTLRELGYRIAHIEAPGTLDGGDVLKHDGTVWVGLGGRTNQAGADQLAGHLEPLGAQVVGVPLTKVLHLKSAVTALPDGTVVGFEELVDDPSVWSSFLAVPEEPGAHVVLLEEQHGVDVGQRTADPTALRSARSARGRRGHDGVREARRLRHLPVRAASRLTPGRGDNKMLVVNPDPGHRSAHLREFPAWLGLEPRAVRCSRGRRCSRLVRRGEMGAVWRRTRRPRGCWTPFSSRRLRHRAPRIHAVLSSRMGGSNGLH